MAKILLNVEVNKDDLKKAQEELEKSFNLKSAKKATKTNEEYSKSIDKASKSTKEFSNAVKNSNKSVEKTCC